MAIYIFSIIAGSIKLLKRYPKHVMDNYNDRSLIKKVAIAAENSRKRHFLRNKYNEGDYALLTNWISKLSLTNNTSKERNQREEQTINELRDMILKE